MAEDMWEEDRTLDLKVCVDGSDGSLNHRDGPTGRFLRLGKNLHSEAATDQCWKAYSYQEYCHQRCSRCTHPQDRLSADGLV